MSDRLWGPGMRKWVRDAPRHGMELGFHTRGLRFEGGGNPYTGRTTDNGGYRILDSVIGRFNTGEPRTIDEPK